MSRGLVRDDRGRIAISHSALNAFRSCRRKYFWRYVEHVVPLYLSALDPREFGKSIHKAAEALRESKNGDDAIVEYWGDVARNHDAFEARERARALLRGYRERWFGDPAQADHSLSVEVLEGKFVGDIVHPISGEVEPGYCFVGAIDMGVRVPGDARFGIHEIDAGLYLYELKTWSRFDPQRITALAIDAQIHMYAHHMSEAFGEPVRGVLYDVAEKCRLEHTEAETPAEFESRKKEWTEKAERGELRGRIRQRKDETDEAFAARCIEAGKAAVAEMTPIEREADESYRERLLKYYADPERFHRVVLELRDEQIQATRLDLWDLCAQHRETLARGFWARNDRACFDFHRACDYWGLCTSLDNPNVLQENFRTEPPGSAALLPILKEEEEEEEENGR